MAPSGDRAGGPDRSGDAAAPAEQVRGGAGHVVLVGLMGSGKSTVGRRLADRLGRPFVDADDELEARSGRTVAEWFAEGEPAFRAAEAELLAELLASPQPTVVAAGGGVVTQDENRELLRRSPATIVWLRAAPAFLASRVAAKEHRPLLQGADAREVLERLAAERHPWYEAVADLVVDVDPFHRAEEKPKRELARTIAGLVRRCEAGATTSSAEAAAP